ncbi:uncharacterized protein LOC117110728 isoform X2 [Anneissia japonica]|uniref:uncharacterized protein LOC117110728 isoform X2 n=1 Tax=Anneissia japonica TaxID=1529436 RepID=UPI001425B62B|nr:uncharacterized protein LOC117110728 isoform X2 [Anneissia japonica]
MEVSNIAWTTELYNVKQIMSKVTLPTFSRVETAYFGEKNLESFSAGQVLWVIDTRQQRRVIAVDKLGNHISIPFKSPVRFQILGKVDEEEDPKTLDEFFREKELPIKVKFNVEDMSSLTLDGASRQASWFEELTLTTKHDLPYLMAVCATKDTIQPDIQCLPVYLQEEFSIGYSLSKSQSDNSTTDWFYFKKHFQNLVDQLVDFNDYLGNPEIIVYPADEVKNLMTSSTDYESLIPHRIDSQYVQLVDSKTKNQERDRKKTAKKKQKKLKLVQSLRHKKKSHSDHTDLKLEDELKSQFATDKKVRPPVPEKPKKYMGIHTKPDQDFYEDIDYGRPAPSSAPPLVPKREPITHQPPTSLTKELNKMSFSKGDLMKELKSNQDATTPYGFPVTSPVVSCKPIKTLEDLPQNPRTMNMSQVQDCLRLLNMDKYVEIFEKNSINGELLTDLDKETLVADLGMSRLNALKLQKFIAGKWAPEALSGKT